MLSSSAASRPAATGRTGPPTSVVRAERRPSVGRVNGNRGPDRLTGGPWLRRSLPMCTGASTPAGPGRRVTALSGPAALHPPPLAHEPGDEARVVAQVAPPQAPRLAGRRNAHSRPRAASSAAPGRPARRGSRRRRRRRRAPARRAARASRPSTSPAWARRSRPRRRRPAALISSATSRSSSAVSGAEGRRVAADDLQPGVARAQVERAAARAPPGCARRRGTCARRCSAARAQARAISSGP